MVCVHTFFRRCSLTILVAAEDPFATHVADPEESQLADHIKNMKTAKTKTTRASLSSGASYSMTAPGDSEAAPKMFSAPPESIQELQVKIYPVA